MDPNLQKILQTFHRRGAEQYGNEAVTQLEHGLQCATLAQENGESAELVTACLLHDLGHLLHDLGDDAATRGVDDRHEYRAMGFLKRSFGAAVTEPIRLHVNAKRYLCAVEPGYWDELSLASKQSLELQGGIFSAVDAQQFIQQPHAPAAVKLRRWDDLAKRPGWPTPQLRDFIPTLNTCLNGPSPRAITHLIYDCDGLLLDTERINWQVNQTIASRYGKAFNESVHRQMIGRTAADSAQIMIDRLPLPINTDDYLSQRYDLVTELYPTAEPLPGAQALTQHFARCGFPQAIATSSIRQRFSQKIVRHQGWINLFQCIVTGDDPAIAQGKPAPDIFLVAASRLGAHPESCLVFEDSPAGVMAAKRAGMAVVAVTKCDRTLFQAADDVVDTLLAFQPETWQLPALPSA